MMKRMHYVVSVLLLLFVAPAALGDFVYWTNPTGSTAYFDWSEGGSANGLYGSPEIIGDRTFLFTPGQFRAEAVNGDTDVKEDTLSVVLNMKSPYALTGIRIVEYGDYALLGDGGSVSISGQLQVENLIAGTTFSSPIYTNIPFPVTQGTGDWQGEALLAGLFDNQVLITVSNQLLAISAPGSSAIIEKKLEGMAFAIEVVIPEPATVALLAFGSLAMLRKKR